MQDMSPIAFLALTMSNGSAGCAGYRERGHAGLLATDHPTSGQLDKDACLDASGKREMTNGCDNAIIELFADALIFAS
jgi:hypothetical protein